MDGLDGRIHVPTPKVMVTFTKVETGDVIGQLIEVDGVLTFMGDADTSAQYFFDWVCTAFNTRIEELKKAKDN